MTRLTFMVLGGAGDLASRLLLPGLAEYATLDPDLDVRIIGVGYRPEDDYPAHVRSALTEAHADPDVVQRLVARTSWVTADATSSDDLTRLLSGRTGRTIIYFALSPAITKMTVDALADVELPEGLEFVLEKPFGTDSASAQELTKALHRFTDEDHILRSDHFLGMSGTVNLRGLLETNHPLADTWNASGVAALTFVFDETLGLEGRAQFYDATGAARDMLQSHLIQTMAHSLADPADGPGGAAEILAATRLDGDATTVARRARYTAGPVDGHKSPTTRPRMAWTPREAPKPWHRCGWPWTPTSGVAYR